ncbi:MAG: hypothetical protein ACMG6E_01300 [Candidatus Roizmanbacteria bacterium]
MTKNGIPYDEYMQHLISVTWHKMPASLAKLRDDYVASNPNLMQ